MPNNITASNLQISQVLYDFIEKEAAPGTGIEPKAFWAAMGRIVDTLAPRNRALLQKRDELQQQIDAWHKSHDASYFLAHRDEYKRFLQDIGYLVPVGEEYKIGTRGNDYEIAICAGPQLVVPVMNARYALNAANARWGSLFDALYGTDVIAETGGAARATAYNPVRGQSVFTYADEFLDQAIPLKRGRHEMVKQYRLANESGHIVLEVELKDHSITNLPARQTHRLPGQLHYADHLAVCQPRPASRNPA